jgi:multiple sugar transport system permease protein
MLRQYMRSIPNDLLDAARIDGARELFIFRKIILPLSGPAVAAQAIFTFNWAWNDYLWPLIILSSSEKQTIQVGIALFVQKNKVSWDQLMAASVLATLPVLIVFLLFQRRFIQGIALSGMK